MRSREGSCGAARRSTAGARSRPARQAPGRIVVGLLAWLVLGVPTAASAAPNIVLILADDLGYETVGANGGRSWRTPHLDRLAAEGARFTACHAAPVCTPSRLMLLTGRYGFRTGQEWGVLPAEEIALPRPLRDAGWATCVAGKWQLARFQEDPDHPRRTGFDSYSLWTWRWDGEKPSRYWRPSIWENGRLRGDVAARYGPDVFVEHIEAWLRARAGSETPFFVFWPLALVHEPFDRVPGRSEGEWRGLSRDRRFGDMVEHMDRLVGRLLSTLEETGRRDETLVIFTGDNGSPRGVRSALGERDVVGGKGLHRDAGTHVPLIVRWPGVVRPGRVVEELVDLTDLFATVLDVAEVAPPSDRPIDGRSLVPLLRGQSEPTPREWVYAQSAAGWSIRDARWRWCEDGRLVDESRGQVIDGAAESSEAAAARARLAKAADALRRPVVAQGAWSRWAIDPAARGATSSLRGADGVRLLDVDGDGREDIATGWEEGGVTRVAFSPGPAEARSEWPAVTVGTARSVEDAVAIDLDADGVLEVLSACEGRERRLLVHRRSTARSDARDPASWTTAPLPASVDLMAWMFVSPLEIDGENGVDLLAGGKGTGAALGWWRSPPRAADLDAWRWTPLRPLGWLMSLDTVDMDGDGDADVLASDRRGARRGAFWLENPGPAAARDGRAWAEHAVAGAEREVMFLSRGDVDGDGLEDVVVAVKPRSIVWARRSDATGRAWTTTEIAWPEEGFGTAKAVAVGDLDHDGRADLVFTCEGADGARSGVGWLPRAVTAFAAPSRASWHDIGGAEGAKFDRLELRDLDADGDLDVVTCEERDGLGVVWYENPLR